ncbi:MAG: DUF2007 domain-containing protein [Chloroflexota bacterium]|nr:DUF2007 domain-containing protein [Chloroflexota bacterium]
MKLIKVYTASGQLEAEMIKTFLESQDLQVILNQESIGRTLGLSAGYLGEVDVLVPESHASKASELIIAMENGEYSDIPNGEFSDDLSTIS